MDKFYAAGEALLCSPCDPPPAVARTPQRGALLLESAAQASYSDEEYLMLVHAKAFIRRIQQGQVESATREHVLSGHLQQLCGGREQFFEALFPGCSRLARAALPHSLRELLLWTELALDLTAVARSAAKVLCGVCSRGAQQGDVMDSATRDALAPQIAQEALAREIRAAVRRVGQDYSRVAAAVQLAEASETAPQALLDQLEPDVVPRLCSTRVARQEDFLGPRWAALVGADLVNFAKYEHMSDIAEPGAAAAGGAAAATAVPVQLAWLERKYEQYPALTEAMAKLLALPYEINKKAAQLGSNALPRLLEPASKIALLRYRPLARQARRLDCRLGAGDSGVRLTCSYHLVPSLAEGVGALLWARGDAGAEAEGREDVADDLLVLHHSTQVHTARPAAASEFFVLCFYAHGKAE